MSASQDRPSAHQSAEALFQAAVRGADPSIATADAVAAIRTARHQRIWLFAFGKAAHAMAAAAATTLQRSLLQIVGGLIVAPEDAPSPYATVTAMRGDHPVPGRHSFAAAAKVGETAAGMKSNDLAIVLVSGGTSSLIGAPLRGMAEGDYSHLYEMLLGSGLDVREMNAVRKRFSRWGGGRLALALAPAATHCFVVSDVIGDDLSTIGSGPCVPDPATVHDVVAILQRANLYQRLAPSFREHLTGTQRSIVPETPKRTHPAFAHVSARVIANNRLALDAAAVHARELGLGEVTVADAPMQGDAASAGAALARALIERRAQSGSQPSVLVCGGETTVSLPPARPTPAVRGRVDVGALPPEPPPRGGRCQELALSAARALAQAGDSARGITLLAAGTDGRDGPTDAAGAIVDASTWNAIAATGRDPEVALRTHEAYPALDAVGALYRTGATNTNVSDIVVGIIAPDA